MGERESGRERERECKMRERAGWTERASERARESGRMSRARERVRWREIAEERESERERGRELWE